MSEDEGTEAADAGGGEATDGETTDGGTAADRNAAAATADAGEGNATSAPDEAGSGDSGVEEATDEATEEAEVDDPQGAVDPDASAEDPTDRGLVDRVADHDVELAREVEALLVKAVDLQETVEDLETERDELEAELDTVREDKEELQSKLRRKQADFQNYKKRAKKRQDQIRERATEDLVERLVDVRDNLKRGLAADHDDVESLESGIEMTLSEFDRVLAEENVEEIAPEAGEAVDPQRHEVMMRVDSDHPEGTVAEVYKPGYEMAGKVIQAAQVTVSEGPSDDATDGDDGPEDDEDGAVPLGDGSQAEAATSTRNDATEE